MADTGRFRERLIDLLSAELKGGLFIFHIANVGGEGRRVSDVPLHHLVDRFLV
jgi:hypothetical protein